MLISYSAIVCVIMVLVGVLAYGILNLASLPWHEFVSGDDLQIYFLCHIMFFMFGSFNGIWVFGKSGLQSVRIAFIINVIWALFYLVGFGAFMIEEFTLDYPITDSLIVPGYVILFLCALPLSVFGFAFNCWVTMNPAFSSPRGQKSSQEFIYFLPDTGKRVMEALERGDVDTLQQLMIKKPVTAENAHTSAEKWALRISGGFSNRIVHNYVILLLITYPGKHEFPALLCLRDITASSGYNPLFFFSESGSTLLNFVPLAREEHAQLKKMLPEWNVYQKGRATH